MSEFIIVFGEVLEASLVVGIIYLILEKSNQLSHLYKLWLGVFSNYCKHFSWLFCSWSLEFLGNDSTAAIFEGIFLYLTNLDLVCNILAIQTCK